MTFKLPNPDLPWPIAMEAVAEIAEQEGLELVAYQCPAKIWTVARGHTRGVQPGMSVTLEQADQLFLEDLTEHANAVRELCTVPADPNELGAMVSLCFNIGIGAFKTSSVLRFHNAGNYAAAARAFLLFDKYRPGPGKPLEISEGLAARRHAEAALYLKAVTQPTVGIPQAVAPAPKIAASPTVQANTAAVVAGSIGVLSEWSDTIGTLASKAGAIASNFGVKPQTALYVAIIVIAGVTLYRRWLQRSEGIA